MEGQHLRPGAGGALREDRHRIALAQGLGHLVHHPQRVALALALDEQRADVADQPAQQRPAQHIRLGDETRLRAAAWMLAMSSQDTWLAMNSVAPAAACPAAPAGRRSGG
jgi:hypothetical protein